MNRRARLLRGAVWVCVPALLATGPVSLFVVTPAAADPVAQLRARATAVSQKLVQDQLEVDAYQQEYSVASAQVAADTQGVAQAAAQISQDQQRADTDSRQVRQIALSSYMSGGGLSGPGALLFSNDAEEVQSANEYAAVAIDKVDAALDELRSAQLVLQAHQQILRQQQDQDRADQARQAVALVDAQDAEEQMALEQSLVTGQLAAAVAAQASAQNAAAKVAVADALTAESMVDPALDPYLECVRHAESRGDYAAVSPNGVYRGAFQFSQPTWDHAALAAGLPNLVGVPANNASKAEQDSVAVALYALDGKQPWLGDRC